MNSRSLRLSYVLLMLVTGHMTGCAARTANSALGQPTSNELTSKEPAVARMNDFATALVKGNAEEVQAFYADDVMLVGPASLTPMTSKKAVLDFHKLRPQKEKLVYFHLRQPRSVTIDGQTAVVIANYETGVEEAGNLTETNGKVLFVLTGKPDAYSIGAEVIVPNVNTGTYGPMGTAITARPWGKFPSRVVPPPHVNEEPSFNAPWQRELFEITKKVNATFPKDSVDAMLAFADERVSIWAGDYGPVYLWGVEQARNHFADFFRTGKMREIRAFRPVIRDFGGVRMVYFQFEETLDVNDERKRSPGQATYLFMKDSLRLAACTETATVIADIGDPYSL